MCGNSRTRATKSGCIVHGNNNSSNAIEQEIAKESYTGSYRKVRKYSIASFELLIDYKAAVLTHVQVEWSRTCGTETTVN